MKEVFIASENIHKRNKISAIFSSLSADILPLGENDHTHFSNYAESGNTFRETAENKALYFSQRYPHTFVIATDGGMDIPGLGNAWNKIHTRRFIGTEDASDYDRLDTLLEYMHNIQDRRMTWYEAVAIALHGKIILSAEVEGAHGIMQREYSKEQYKPGIWLCTLWFFPQFGKNFFELTEQEKEHAEISWLKIENEITKFWKNSIVDAEGLEPPTPAM